MSALEFARVSKLYGRRQALREIELRVPKGSALGLLGPNGAGKTTALRLLLGFTRPTAGSVRLRGCDAGEPRSRVGVGYLPERLRLPERMTTEGLLRLHGRLVGLAGGELEREIAGVLDKTGLADRGRDRLGSLSKGLLQRAGFAQALLGRPDVLLLDEPTSGLDPLGIRDARDWIQQERDRGCTVLVSSHGLSEVERICDSAVILHEGRIVKQGPIDSLAEPGESLEDAFVRAVRG
jgi:ABC-2 type transport system ATP-binding protein